MANYVSFADVNRAHFLGSSESDSSGSSKSIPSALAAISSHEGNDSPSLHARVTSPAATTISPASTPSPTGADHFDFESSLEDDLSAQEVIGSTGTTLTAKEYKQISNFIDANRSNYEGKTVYCHSKEVGLPRSVSFYDDGTVYIHLNQVRSENDELLGNGIAKKAKYSINYDTKEVCARASGIGNWKTEIGFFDRTKDVARTVKLYHSQTFQSKKQIEKTEMLMPLYNKRTLSDLSDILLENARYDNGDCEITSDDEVKKQMASLISETVSELHDADISHGDLHEGNIFLDETGAPIVADFGFAKSNASPTDKLNDLLQLHLLFTSTLSTDDQEKELENQANIEHSFKALMDEEPVASLQEGVALLEMLVDRMHVRLAPYAKLATDLSEKYQAAFPGTSSNEASNYGSNMPAFIPEAGSCPLAGLKQVDSYKFLSNPN